MTAAAAIIHCATSTRGDAEATRNLVAAASRTGSAHLVYVSIVGIDRLLALGEPAGRVPDMAGPQVRGEESDARRGGPVVPGEHADVATAVL